VIFPRNAFQSFVAQHFWRHKVNHCSSHYQLVQIGAAFAEMIGCVSCRIKSNEHSMKHGDLRTAPPHRQQSNLLSIIVPCYNEQEVISFTHDRLLQVMKDLTADKKLRCEIIYVDDGSQDQTANLLTNLSKTTAEVRVVLLSRNFGQQLATAAGLQHASGDCAVTIDADLQDPPELMAEMVRLWRTGFDVVYGQRLERTGESRFKIETARAFYRGLNALSDIDIPIDTGDFRLIDRCIIDAIGEMPERDRYLRGMVAWAGFRQTVLPYRRDPRLAGKSKYPLSKLIRIAADGILSFSLAPLRFVITVGILIVFLAASLIVYALINRLFTNNWISGWTMLFTSIMMLGGVQLTVLGVIGEYVGRIYMESKGRPLFLIKAKIGFPTLPKRSQ
jgi:dolichol-phosphate mannosyltransferase